ncbi:ComEA family DNA-binding protein [Cellulomonas wangsupingiae]|uniref:ComEA family DNA-binding protein n=1 Tax=Cellulomonas wangsupingiae TaxID=2968085 RepID=UPI001D0F2502|nr:ComEA family DNA-binding protein [Cellulomonas wangsupingiae]MCM0641465.1 ComEA family DNA-binding protein [Cellulomonas wangsupingiae]
MAIGHREVEHGDVGQEGADLPWRPTVSQALSAAAADATTVPLGEAPRAAVRWVPDWRTVGAAVVVLALVAGGLALRAGLAPRGEPVIIPTPAVPGEAGGTSPAAGTAPPAVPVGSQERVVVHVVGAVARPGVVELALGARVSDAVAASGGSLPAADLAGVNLARVLADGEQLVVPVVGEVAAAPVQPAHDGLVDLATADAATLEELPGVGPVLAERIVEHRTAHPFTSVDELDDVPGIGPALLADLRTRVRV